MPSIPSRLAAGAFAAAIVVTLTGCGDESLTPAATAPTATTPATRTDTPKPRTARPVEVADPVGPGIPDDFPLADGLPGAKVTGTAPIKDIEQCGDVLWSTDGAVDVAGAAISAPEDSRARTLALYATEDEAIAALDAIRTGFGDCPVDSIGGTDQVYAEVEHTFTGSVFTHRYRGEQGFDTGLEVLQVQQEGPALYVASYYGEGGGSAKAIRDYLALVADSSRGVLAALADTFGGDEADVSDVDLAQGLTADTGDGGRQDGPSATAQGISFPNGFCADYPEPGSTPRWAVTVTGPEYRESRELLDLGTDQAAGALVEGVRQAVGDCPVLPRDREENTVTFTELPANSNQREVVLAYTYAQGTGGSVYELVQVGRYVLATEQVGEWLSSSVADGAVTLGDENAAVVADVHRTLDVPVG